MANFFSLSLKALTIIFLSIVVTGCGGGGGGGGDGETPPDINAAPASDSQAISLDEDSSVNITLTGSDLGGAALTFSVDSLPSNGVLSGVAPNLLYTANANFHGSDSFVYHINNGARDSSPSTVNITITSINDAPILMGQAVVTDEDQSVNVTLSGTDIDSSGITYVVTSGPSNGVLSDNFYKGSYSTLVKAKGVTVAGDYAYVADATSGLQIIDISNPNQPVLKGSYDTPGYAWNVAVAGGYAYVADASSGLQIIDISDPNQPLLKGSHDTPSSAYYVVVAGDYAYVTDSASGLQIIDISNPNQPLLTGSYDTPSLARGVAVTGSHAYVADAISGLQIIDISDPYQPTLTGSYDTPSSAWDVVVAGGHAYVADAISGLQIIDISDPSQPLLKGSYDTPSSALDVAVAGGHAYVADATSGLQIIDISNPSQPLLKASYDTPSSAMGITVTAGYAYVADAYSGLQIYTEFGDFIYTPNTNFYGSDSFTLEANDGDLSSPPATIELTINAVNDAPVADSHNIALDEDSSTTVTLSGSDAEGASLNYSVDTPPANGVLSGAAPNLLYTPNANFHGSDSFIYHSNDAEFDSTPATIQLTVNAVNDAPVADNQNITLDEDTPTTITLTGSDTEGTTLSYSIDTPPSNGVLSGTAPNLLYTPHTNFHGSDSFTLSANDGDLSSPLATIELSINALNDAPVADSHNITLDEDSSATVTLSGSDAEGATLNYSIDTLPANGVLSGVAPNLLYTPNANFHGNDSFIYHTNDAVLNSNPATIQLTVNAVNDAPVAQPGILTTDEETTGNGIVEATDDSPTLTYSIVTNGSQGTATITNANTGAYSYTPDPDAEGGDSFTFKANDGGFDSNTATITVTINPINDAPVAQAGSLTMDEDTTGSGTVVATDVDNPTLSYSIVTNGSKGTATITNATTGAYNYTPDPDAEGGDSFTFKANDGDFDSNTATITVTINPINDAPVAQAGSLTTDEDTTGSGTVVATDIDSPTLSYSIITNGSKGTATITNAATGAYSYTPDLDANGSDSFTFKANDGFFDSNTATITVTINPTNDAPVAQAGTLTTEENTIGNDTAVATDIDSPTLSYSIVTNGSKGTATITNAATGAYSYTPNLDASGSDSFTFKANDGFFDSNTATITISITLGNDAPVAQAGSLTTDEDTTGSDTAVATDLDSPTLSYSIVTNGSKGTATITNATTGAYSYTPDLDANGSDSFTFKANDGFFDSNDATVTVTITPIDDPPIAAGSCGTTAQAQTLIGFLSASDPDTADPIPDLLTYNLKADGSGLSGPIVTAKGGTINITDSATGAFTYLPATGFGDKRGLDSFQYQVTDGNTADSATQTVVIDQKIMPLGDSITMGEVWVGPNAGDHLGPDGLNIGYRESLFDSLNDADYTFDFVGSLNHGDSIFSDTNHEGHGGWTATEIAYGKLGSGGAQAWLDSNPADIILLHAGTNELLSTSAADIENILIEIETWEGSSNGNPVTVLLALIIDRDPIEPYVTTFNAAVQSMALSRIAGGDDIIIVDQHSALTYPEDLSEDISVVGISKALHPNTAGYIKMADRWFQHMGSVVNKCP